MINKKTLFISLIVLSGLLHVVGLFFDLKVLWFPFKILFIAAVAYYYFVFAKTIKTSGVLFMLVTFLSELSHDFDGDNFFMLGMILTTISHVVLIGIVSKGLIKTKGMIKFLAFVPFALMTYFFIAMFLPGLNDFLIPAIAFGIVLTILCYLSGVNFLTRRSTSSMMFLMGVLFFYVQSISAGINRFYLPNDYFPILTTISFSISIYLLGEYLILESNINTKSQ